MSQRMRKGLSLLIAVFLFFTLSLPAEAAGGRFPDLSGQMLSKGAPIPLVQPEAPVAEAPAQTTVYVNTTQYVYSAPVVKPSVPTYYKIGSRGYTSLQAAVSNVRNGETIVVKKNTTTSATVQADRKVSFTIDFQNYAYNYTGKNYAFQIMNGNVAIKNAKISGKVTQGSYYFFVKRGAGLRLLNGYFGGPCVNNFGSVTVSGGNYKFSRYVSFMNRYWGTLRVSGGNIQGQTKNFGKLFVSKGSLSCKGYEALVNYGTCTITGGSLNGEVYNGAIRIHKKVVPGTMTIYGGSITASGEKAVALYNYWGNVTIEGGTFTSKGNGTIYNYKNCKMTISDGTFRSAKKYYTMENYGIMSVFKASIGNGIIQNSGAITKLNSSVNTFLATSSS